MNIAVIDYGMGNLGSIRRAVEECGAMPHMTRNPLDLSSASHIILPGVGAFGRGMRNLTDNGWIAPIKKAVLDDGIPLLGICLGMHLLAEFGHEGGKTQGLGLISGEVKKLIPVHENEYLPHIGWNNISIQTDSFLLDGVPDQKDFYFVHSYHLICADAGHIVATTPYCGELASVVNRDNIYGTQFHPEKSQKFGLKILENFIFKV